MSNSKSKLKKIICSSILCLGFLTTAVTGININKPTDIQAVSNSGFLIEDVTSTVFGNGYNFNTSVSKSPNTSVTGWSYDSLKDKASDNEFKRGVVDFKNETSFSSEDWELESQPKMPNQNSTEEAYHKNLMINSYDAAGKLGYESSKSLSLEANSFYKISVLVYTHKTSSSDPRASIYLTGLIDDTKDENYSQTKFENFSTLGAWEEYSYYIDTKEAKSVKIQLWLGSQTDKVQGAVFFNKVTIDRYSEHSYLDEISLLNDNNNDNFNIISFSPDYSTPVDNSSFEDTANLWTKKHQSTSISTDQICKIVDVNSSVFINDELTIKNPGSNCSLNNQSALFMYNKNDGYQAIESSEFVINQHSYYKLSFWAKSDCNIGSGANVQLVDKSEENAISNASLTLTTTYTTDSNKYRNDWTQYSFYIYGASNKNTNATIQIWLGTQDSKTSGYVFVDDFRLETIDHTTYSANSSATNATTFNLNQSNDKYVIANGEFNITENPSQDNIYPATPASWAQSGSNNSTTFSGIVNTNETIFNENIDKFGQGITYPTRPNDITNADNNNNNVLMIGSTAETNKQSFTSKEFTLTANSYYNVSLYVMTNYTSKSSNSEYINDYGARVTVSSSTKTIFDLFNINFDDNDWHKINVKIKTGTNEEKATIKLTFDNWIGHVFFDKIELQTITADTYNDTTFESANKPYKIDLTYENFDNKTFDKNPTPDGIETPNSWDFSSQEAEVGVHNGIIRSDNTLLQDIPTSLSGNKTFLYISSTHDGNYSYTSKEQFTFKSQNYYKISVNILTNNIVKDEIDDSVTDDTLFGANIKLADSNEILLKGINSNGVWQTYNIFASFTNELVSAISLGLGYSDATCMGEVLFDNLTIETMDADSYNKAIEDAKVGTYATFTNYTAPVEDPKEETTPWKNTFNWLIIPSLITGLAIIIAVVGFYVKKISFNRKPKIKTNYDRRRTLDKDIDRREKIALRQQIIDELKNELSSIDKEIEEFNILSNEKLEEIKAEINAEKEELKKQQLELEIRKKEATAEREKQLKSDADFVANTKAEKEYNSYIAKLDKQEMLIQKKISDKEFKLATAKEINNEKLNKYTARQEYIRLQIAKIEAEIEEIARQEEAMWAEYKAAKAEAKRRKTEYKAQIKAEKLKQQSTKKSSTKTSSSNSNKKDQTNTTKKNNSKNNNDKN